MLGLRGSGGGLKVREDGGFSFCCFGRVRLMKAGFGDDGAGESGDGVESFRLDFGRFAHVLKCRTWGTHGGLRFVQARVVSRNPGVETGEGAAIHLFDFSIRHPWLFLRFHLYPDHRASLFLYFFDGLARGVNNGARSKIAQLGMSNDPFDRGGVRLRCSGFGQVADGDLEAIKEESGAFGVDVAAGDALDNFSDATLNGAAVLGCRQLEEVGAAPVFAQNFDGLMSGVMVVAELFVAQARAAAATAVGEDVAATVASGWLFGWLDDLV
ncbi:MAG: hypothetical protein ABI158_08690 [Edaphobacter sp.]